VPSNAFEYFLGRQNARIVKVLEDNRDISEAIQGLLERIVEHCDQRGIPPHKVAIRDPYITHDGEVMFRLVRR
jgi:hypothetical protein